MLTRRTRRIALLSTVLVAVAMLAGGAGIATGHTTLESSDPPDGASLAESPAEITLSFSEVVVRDLARVGLVDGAGREIKIVARPEGTDTAETLTFDVPRLDGGVYRVTWRIVDANDLHVSNGTIVFGVGAPAGAAATADVGGTEPLEAAIRWLDLVAQFVVVGALAVAFLLPGSARKGAGRDAKLDERHVSELVDLEHRTLRLAALAAVIAMVMDALLVIDSARAAAGSGAPISALIDIAGTRYGYAWLIREAALTGIVVLILRRMSRSHPASTAVDPVSDHRPFLGASALLISALGIGAALSGHIGGGSAGSVAIRLAALGSHHVAAGAWVGGLIVMAILVAPMTRTPSDRPRAIGLLGRFWLIAVPSVMVLATSGLYLSGELVSTFGALIGSDYGHLLLVKTSLVILVGLIGVSSSLVLHHRRRLAIVRQMARRRPSHLTAAGWLRGSTPLEATFAVLVVLAAAAMGATPPARGPVWEPRTDARQADVTVPASDLLIDLSIKPNVPGPNLVTVRVLDTRRPASAPIAHVDVRLVDRSGQTIATFAFTGSDDGVYVGATNDLVRPEALSVNVEVQRQGLPTASARAGWTVDRPGAGEITPVMLAARVSAVTTPAAIVVGVAAMVATLGWAVRRRRRPGRPLEIDRSDRGADERLIDRWGSRSDVARSRRGEGVEP